jgi:hypothetical protein
MIAPFLKNLQSVPETRFFANPYNKPGCAQNLEVYLNALIKLPYSGHLMVGEALGYRGGALTGIPFSSPRILRTHPHPFLKALRPSLIINNNVAESTATIVWNHLQNCRAVPACWNVFPFQPHNVGNLDSNRTPRSPELDTGYRYLDSLIKILNPHTLISVGKVAEAAVKKWYPELTVAAVRHPSHGGKRAFIAGLTRAGVC